MTILIVGAGSIGRRHALNASNFATTQVIDLNTENYETLGSVSNIELLDPNHNFEGQSFDGVIVATPHSSHIALARKFLYSTKHILIEKPISNELSTLDSFQAEVKAAGCSIYVVSNMRFHPAVILLAENMDKIGEVRFSSAYYGNYLPSMRPNADYRKLYAASRDAGGGVILDAIHEIDYLCWLLGQANAVQSVAEKISDLDIDVEDYASINLLHDKKIMTEIHLDYLQQFKRRGCDLIGSKGTLTWRSEGKKPEHCTVRLFEKETESWTVLLDDQDLNNAKPYEDMMESFIAVIKGGTRGSLSTMDEGIQNLKLALLALESAKSGERKYV